MYCFQVSMWSSQCSSMYWNSLWWKPLNVEAEGQHRCRQKCPQHYTSNTERVWYCFYACLAQLLYNPPSCHQSMCVLLPGASVVHAIQPNVRYSLMWGPENRGGGSTQRQTKLHPALHLKYWAGEILSACLLGLTNVQATFLVIRG